MFVEGIITTMIGLAILAMATVGSMDYIESGIKEDCEKIGYFLIQDKVYKCELKK